MITMLVLKWLWLVTVQVHALNPIIAVGNKLFDAVTEERFYVKGLGYHMDLNHTIGILELTDIVACQEHVGLAKDMGVNLIRYYNIDHTKDHHECMELLENEKIYVGLDLDSNVRRDISINHYDVTVLDRYKNIIDVFDKYDNVAFYFIGLELTYAKCTQDRLTFYRTSMRDIKSYIKTKRHQILVGTISSDDKKMNECPNLDLYQNCGNDEGRPDFIGVRTYGWSKYDEDESKQDNKLIKEYELIGLPVFISDLSNSGLYHRFPKKFENLYNIMDKVFSGGIVDEFGLYITDVVTLNEDHHLNKTYPPKFEMVKGFLTNNPKLRHYKKDYELTRSTPLPCPVSSDNWSLNTQLPPTPNHTECDCMFSKLECVAHSKNKYYDFEFQHATNLLLNPALLPSPTSPTSFINSNFTTGQYGPGTGCSPRHRLSYLTNQYYLLSGRTKFSCFSHLIQSPQPGDPEKCFKNYQEPDKSFAHQLNFHYPVVILSLILVTYSYLLL